MENSDEAEKKFLVRNGNYWS